MKNLVIYATIPLLLIPLPRTYAAWYAAASLLDLSSCAIRSLLLPATSLAAGPRCPSLAVKHAAWTFTKREESYRRYWPRITLLHPSVTGLPLSLARKSTLDSASAVMTRPRSELTSPKAPTTSSRISPCVSSLATQGPISPGPVPL